MRILHTADWHLGKRLDFYSRLDEQKQVLQEICAIAEEKEVDVIFIAGDLFDTFNPANEATELLYKTLKKLAKNGEVPVIAIAGNHDSPDRVNVADVLARENGIILIGNPTDTVPEFKLEDGFKLQNSEPGFFEIGLPQYDFPVRVIHTAFANEVRLKEYFGEDKQQSLQKSLGQRWQNLAQKHCDRAGVNLLTTHLFVQKRGNETIDEPEGEKPLNIGNADIIYSNAIPKEIQYAALGHLHSYQDVGTNQPVVYSSSPLRYSFAEAGQQKYVVLVDTEPEAQPEIEKIPLQSGEPLKKKHFKSVKASLEWLQKNPEALVEMTLETDDYLKAEDRKRLYQTHNGIIRLIPKVKNAQLSTNSDRQIDLDQDIETLFRDYFKSKYEGQAPNSEIMDLFKEIQNT